MAKTRVHELAKEFGVESKFVLEKFKEMGEFVKSASSTVELPAEMRFRKEVGESLKSAAAAAPAAEAAAPAAAAKKSAARPGPKPGPKAPAAEPEAPAVAEPVVEAPAETPAPACPSRGGAGRAERSVGRGAARCCWVVGVLGAPQGTVACSPSGRSPRCAPSGQQPVLVQPGHGTSSRHAAPGCRCRRRW